MAFSLKVNLSLISLLSLIGCNKSEYQSRFSEGECVMEQVDHYASYVKQKGPIYKIESKKDNKFKVSVWYNSSWLYQGEKPLTYFKDRKKLVYKGMNCPDGRSKASITDKIKGIDI
jgi:hypothetical protein